MVAVHLSKFQEKLWRLNFMNEDLQKMKEMILAETGKTTIDEAIKYYEEKIKK